MPWTKKQTIYLHERLQDLLCEVQVYCNAIKGSDYSLNAEHSEDNLLDMLGTLTAMSRDCADTACQLNMLVRNERRQQLIEQLKQSKEG